MSTKTLEIDRKPFEGKPHIWIQWKGTDVCCDIHCKCGAHLHGDGDFMYAIKCLECGQLYECGSHVALYPVDSVDYECVFELADEHIL